MEKKKNQWIWYQDISTLFSLFVLSFAAFSLFVSIGEGNDMDYTISAVVPEIVNLGSLGTGVVGVILFIWLAVLVVMRARGKLKNQQAQQESAETYDPELAEALRELTAFMKDQRGGDNRSTNDDE